MRQGPVAFLFLGETLLIPHLWPIAEALAKQGEVAVDLWVATSVHEELLKRWSAGLGGHVRIRRAPGFKRVPSLAPGDNPPLPAKLPLLARLAPKLWRAPVAVCAEQTSLWLPRMLPFHPAKFVKTSHGVGSMSARDDPRRRAAWAMCVPSERERATYLERGFDPGRVVATGYVKASFCADRTVPRFSDARPTILYTPHWQRHRSSWWEWGAQVARAVADDGRWNLIFAPHQRLVEKAGDLRAVAADLAARSNVHVDLDSFACVDGSYTAAADIYLGDTSSQLIEFAAKPRPAVFLNPRGVDWRGDPDYAMWAAGEVVDDLAGLIPALVRAPAKFVEFADAQRALADSSLGPVDGSAPARVVEVIRAALAA